MVDIVGMSWDDLHWDLVVESNWLVLDIVGISWDDLHGDLVVGSHWLLVDIVGMRLVVGRISYHLIVRWRRHTVLLCSIHLPELVTRDWPDWCADLIY